MTLRSVRLYFFLSAWLLVCRTLFAQDSLSAATAHALDTPRVSTPLYASLIDFASGRLRSAQNTLIAVIERAHSGSIADAASRFLLSLEILSLPKLSSDRIEIACQHLDEVNEHAFLRENQLAAELFFWRGECARLKSEFSRALEEYNRALRTRYEGEVRYFAHLRIAEIADRLSYHEDALAAYDTLAATKQNPLALEASLRRAALFYRIGRPEGALTELARSRSLYRTIHSSSSRVEEVIGSPLQEILTGKRNPSTWYLPFDVPPHRSDYHSFALVSTLARIALIEGNALTEMGRYDSAIAVFDQGKISLSAIPDSLFLAGERSYYHDGLEFEKAWAYFRKGAYRKSAEAFHALALRDTLRQSAGYVAASSRRFNDEFYEESLPLSTTTNGNGNESRSLNDAFFYNDFPARARYYAGIAYAKAGESRQALALLSELTQQGNALYSERSRFYQALVEFQQGRMYQAEVLLEPLGLRRSQIGAYASLLLGDIYYRRASFAKAAEYFEFALEVLPETDRYLRARTQLELGLSLIPLAAWKNASSALAAYLAYADKASVGYDEALFWLGRSYFRSDSMAQAREAFEQLLRNYPESERRIDAQYAYAWTLFRTGTFQKAAAAFAEVVRMDSVTRYAYDALSRQGDAYYALDDLPKALAIYNKAVDRPTFNQYLESRAMFQLGVARLKADSVRSAMNAFTHIITKLPASDIVDRAYYNLALAAYAIRLDDRAQQAIAQLEKSFPSSPYASRGALLVAEEYERNGNTAAALAGYKRIMKSYPSSDEFLIALFNAIDLLAEAKRYPEAIAIADSQLISKLTAPVAYAPRLIIRKAELQHEAGDHEQAIRTARSFLGAYPKDALVPNAYYTIGKALVAKDDIDRGHATYRMITDSFPASDAAAFSYLQLARIEAKQARFDAAANFYTQAFDLRYYSTDAAPIAMAEYAALLRSRAMPDSALKIYDEIARRYLLETSAGSNAQFEAVEILLEKDRTTDAISRLERVAQARKGERTGGEARLKIASVYRRQGLTKKALAEYELARKENILTLDQKGRSLLGSAEMSVALGNKRTAAAILRDLLATRGIPRGYRLDAEQLLEKIAPKKIKRPARKGKR